MKVSALGKLGNEPDNKQKLQMYKSLVEPHFAYCASITFLSNSIDLDRLQILQNKCLRQILRAIRFSSSSEMLKILNLIKNKTTNYLTNINIHS